MKTSKGSTSNDASFIKKFSVFFFFGLLIYAVATLSLSIWSVQVTDHARSSQTNRLILPISNEGDVSPLTGLSCEAYGGPEVDVAREMVYWQDIPSDRCVLSLLLLLYLNLHT
jgi:hypothetical protein